MNNIKFFSTETEYNASGIILPSICYVKDSNKVYYNNRHAVDKILNAPLMELCTAKGWAKESEDYLTYEEAALVTSIADSDLIEYGITRLIEMKYFTALTEITLNNTPVEVFYLNNNCTAKFNTGNSVSSIKYLKLADDIVSLNEASDTHANISQYCKFSGITLVGGKDTLRFSTKWGGNFSAKNVVLPHEEIITSTSGVNMNKTENIYVPDNLVDGYKEAYATYASKFHRISEFVDPYSEY